MKKQIAWIFGGAAIVGLGMMSSLSACSGDDTKTDSGTKDATSDTKANDVTQQDVVQNDSQPPQDAGADCKTPSGPFSTDAGPFCPFQVGADGGTVFSACADGQHCCIPNGNGASTCQAGACTFPDAGSDFQCNETNDCPGNNMVCCENAGAEISQDVGCTAYDFVSKQHGTSCVANACPAGQ